MMGTIGSWWMQEIVSQTSDSYKALYENHHMIVIYQVDGTTLSNKTMVNEMLA